MSSLISNFAAYFYNKNNITFKIKRKKKREGERKREINVLFIDLLQTLSGCYTVAGK